MDYPPIQELIPHSGQMLLVDRIAALNGTSGICQAKLNPDRPYFDRQEFDSFWMVEIMAQSVASIYALCSRLKGRKVKKGFIITIDDYEWLADTHHLAAGDDVEIEVQLEYDIHPFGKYQTTARKGERVLAQAQMKFVVDDGEVS